jgi:hypothetical protein
MFNLQIFEPTDITSSLRQKFGKLIEGAAPFPIVSKSYMPS